MVGGGTIHCKPMQDDVVRVTVEEAHDSNAPLPLPTEELQVVGQALKTFIAWPKHLVKPLSAKVCMLLYFHYVFTYNIYVSFCNNFFY